MKEITFFNVVTDNRYRPNQPTAHDISDISDINDNISLRFMNVHATSAHPPPPCSAHDGPNAAT
jgi:hypothetical protein